MALSNNIIQTPSCDNFTWRKSIGYSFRCGYRIDHHDAEISDRFAPHEIVTGRRLNLDHLKAPFGEYIEASVDADVTNDIKGRTHACISLEPSRNWQGL